MVGGPSITSPRGDNGDKDGDPSDLTVNVPSPRHSHWTDGWHCQGLDQWKPLLHWLQEYYVLHLCLRAPSRAPRDREPRAVVGGGKLTDRTTSLIRMTGVLLAELDGRIQRLYNSSKNCEQEWMSTPARCFLQFPPNRDEMFISRGTP